MKTKIFITLFIYFITICFADTNPFYIQNNELKENELLALKGDAESADDLSFFYTFSEENQKEKIQYWASIAAENDSTGRCQYNYFVLITSDVYKLDDFKRGLFWLYKSSLMNYKNASKNIYFKKDDPVWFEFADNSLFVKPITDESDIDSYKNAAICGSGNAALRLLELYNNQNDSQLYEYWLRIGAQNGSKECMKKYAEILKQSTDKYDNIRAEFWEKKLRL